MTQKEKQLLLVDICERLPYNIRGEGFYEEEAGYENQYHELKKVVGHIDGINHIGFDDDEIYVIIEGIQCELSTIKLYLRPMASMTEEEKEEYCVLQDRFLQSSQYPVTDAYEIFDWLNAHHIDYRSLIEKGLALKATEGMY